jgi:hypothetical protein
MSSNQQTQRTDSLPELPSAAASSETYTNTLIGHFQFYGHFMYVSEDQRTSTHSCKSTIFYPILRYILLYQPLNTDSQHPVFSVVPQLTCSV